MEILVGYGVGSKLRKFIENAKKRIVVVTPFISRHYIDLICSKAAEGIRTTIVVDCAHALDLCLSTCSEVEIRCLDELHAKMYMLDNVFVLGSLNLTDQGIERNFEVAVVFSDDSCFEQLRKAIDVVLELAKRIHC